MNIIYSDGLLKAAVQVFVLKKGEKPTSHGLFRLLSVEDKAYLKNWAEKTDFFKDYAYNLFLPSGRHAFFLSSTEKAKWNHRKSILAMRKAIVFAKKEGARKIQVLLEDFSAPQIKEGLGELLATQFEMANFEFNIYKTKPKDGWVFITDVCVTSKSSAPRLQEALDRGKIVGEEINAARSLTNTPGGDMTPERLAKEAERVGLKYGIKVQVLNTLQIRKLKMGGVLGVARGSGEEPKFIVMEYMHGKKTERPVVLVGKGVTFDTGGLNLKPTEYIYEMHMDMSGGAAVIHTIASLARLGVKKNIVGLIPAVENMPSGSSYHPGDLLRTMSGKTIEVLNTDAEGRVILSDALTYAREYNPRLVIDIATLTGAAGAALGQRASALFATDTRLEERLTNAGEATGDFVWPLPLWEEYEDEIRGTFGDIANTGKTKYGGAITGAVFLWQFIKDIPWAHIDIAPRMTSIEGEFLAKGAAGASIGLLTNFLRKF